jgi:hypothetical protein
MTKVKLVVHVNVNNAHGIEAMERAAATIDAIDEDAYAEGVTSIEVIDKEVI